MKISIVVKRGWVLERLAQELSSPLLVGGPEISINCGEDGRRVDPQADVVYYMPAKNIRRYPANTWQHVVGLFTHGDNALDILDHFDTCVTMNTRMLHRLEAIGHPRVRTIRPGVTTRDRPIRFGVVGRTYPDGRKGETLVKRAVEDGFLFQACAPKWTTPWGCPVTRLTPDRSAFYDAIDYLVVTSSEEGGPMCVPEAIERGVPVIAPNVGWCWEFPVIRYDAESWTSLRMVLVGLTRPPTWTEWRTDHLALFRAMEEQPAREAR